MEETIEVTEPEERKAEAYEVTSEEMLTLQLLTSRLETQHTALQLAQQSLAVFKNNIAGKYSEFGKYTLLGEIDQRTRKGRRILAE